MVSIRAVYKNGQLHPLDPVELQEGEEVQLQIVKPAVRLVDIVADMLVSFEPVTEAIDEMKLQAQVDAALKGKRPLSEIIIEDRHEGA